MARFPGRIPKGRVCHSLGSMMDILPTVAHVCNVPLPKNPPDGINIWPLLSGQKAELEREALLYFDNWNLQCARLGRWKLHLARYNSDAYSQAPAGGRFSFPLQNPELYDLENAPDESYDVAPEHPEVVKDIQARVERLMAGFPEEPRKAWAATKARSNREPRVGALPRP
jgi:arylsulfatase